MKILDNYIARHVVGGALLALAVLLSLTAAGCDFDSHVQHGHLRPGDGAHEHELVEVPQVTYPEQLARDLRESGTEGEQFVTSG